MGQNNGNPKEERPTTGEETWHTGQTRPMLPRKRGGAGNLWLGINAMREYYQKMGQGQNATFSDSSDVRDRGSKAIQCGPISGNREQNCYKVRWSRGSPGYYRLWPVVGIGRHRSPRLQTFQLLPPPPILILMSRSHALDRKTPGVEKGALRPPCPSALTLAHQVVIGFLRRPPHTPKEPLCQ